MDVDGDIVFWLRSEEREETKRFGGGGGFLGCLWHWRERDARRIWFCLQFLQRSSGGGEV